jgi:hypothetical protein
MPANQKKDLDRLQRLIERDGLTSCMNHTKWQAAFAAVQAVSGYTPKFRARLVTGDDDPQDRWDGSFPWHVPTHQFIEWLELDPVVRVRRGQLLPDAREDFTQVLSQALLDTRVPFSLENGVLRIWGYLRPGCAPRFVTSTV